MKKFAMAAVAAAALSTGAAHAYTSGTFSNGFLVPNVINNGDTDATAVGLINQSGEARAVYWVFFDQDSNHLLDGCFVMTDKQYRPFVWSDSGVPGASAFKGTRGYLVFSGGASTRTIITPPTGDGTVEVSTPTRVPHTTCQTSAQLPVARLASSTGIARDGAGNNTVVRLGMQLSGNAFQVNVANRDAEVIPTVPGLVVNDFIVQTASPEIDPATGVRRVPAPGLNGASGNTVDIVRMGPEDLIAVTGAATTARASAPGFPSLATGVEPSNLALTTANFSLRYFIDGNKAAGGNDTRIAIWSTGDHRGSYTVNAYDNNQNRTSVNIPLVKAELDYVNPETSVVGLPSSFTDGFIEFEPFFAKPAGAPANVLTQGVNGAVAVDPTLFANGGSVFSYSSVTSTAFGAVQTILNAHRNR